MLNVLAARVLELVPNVKVMAMWNATFVMGMDCVQNVMAEERSNARGAKEQEVINHISIIN